ncbi:MAG: heat-inducible transcriptional repressor HrcA [Dehalococcoidia bacterium]
MAVGKRRDTVLRVIVEDYITGATPVASRAIVERHGLNVSPATIRNDTAYLEREGYVVRPHHSAGSVPTDKAYRHYVQLLGEDVELPAVDEYLTYYILRETKEGLEHWLKTVASLLAGLVRNMVVITSPKPVQCRFKHLDLVVLQDFMALLIVVLCEARVRRHVLSFNRRIGQDELTTLANKLTHTYAGLTAGEILARQEALSTEEKQISGLVAEVITAEDKLEYGEPHLEGLRLLLGQPEFTSSPSMLRILEALEGQDWIRNIFSQEFRKGEVRVLIGDENPEPALQELSLVASQYGQPDRSSGIVGVVGPKRMDYARTISTLNCLSALLSARAAEYT